MKTTNIILLSTVFLALSCDDDREIALVELPEPTPVYRDISQFITPSANGKAKVSKYALYKAQYLTTGQDGKMGNTVFFMDIGNKQLDSDFVPDLSLDGTTNVSYYVDQNRPSADLPVNATTTAINNAMATWDNLTCSELGMFEIPFDERPTGFVAEILGVGGSLLYVADILHSGWFPGFFFDILEEDGSTFILAVTFDIIFVDEAGDPVDTDNNGKIDIAWREIYYNDAFNWAIGSTFDVETVALHEAGHGLSQAHFGTAFLSAGNGVLHFAPRAVMNAAYSGVQISIGKSDIAGHCSNWAEWPNH